MGLEIEKGYVGQGRLAEEDGTSIAPAVYRVQVLRKMIPDGLGGEIHGMASVSGSLSEVDPILMRRLLREQKRIILFMDEHRLMLRIFISGSDTFTGRGGLPEPIKATGVK